MIYTSLADKELLRLVQDVLVNDSRSAVAVNKQLLNELADRFELMLSSAAPAHRTTEQGADPNQLKLPL
jgi:hypothetical protein